MVSNDKAILYFDGGCRPNPGAMRIAYVINNKGCSTTLAIGTNNVAEYTALITGLKECIKKEYKEIIVRGDSLLVIKQMLGEWKIKDKKLVPLNIMAKLLCKKIKVNFEWVPREKNLAGKILEN